MISSSNSSPARIPLCLCFLVLFAEASQMDVGLLVSRVIIMGGRVGFRRIAACLGSGVHPVFMEKDVR